MNTYIKKKKIAFVFKSILSYFLGYSHQPTPNFEFSMEELSWYIMYVITNLFHEFRLKDVNEDSEERESLVWFGLGLCGLSRWVNFRVRCVGYDLVLFQVGLKIALGFGCLVLIFWIWVGWFSWFVGQFVPFNWVWLWVCLKLCMGLWELSLIDEVGVLGFWTGNSSLNSLLSVCIMKFELIFVHMFK